MNEVIYSYTKKPINTQINLYRSTHKLGLAHKTIQFYAIQFVQKYYQPENGRH